MKKIAILATAAALFNLPVQAQEAQFNGNCTAFSNNQAGCEATGWCTYRPGRPITLPNGVTVQTANVCAFKPYYRQAWMQQQGGQR